MADREKKFLNGISLTDARLSIHFNPEEVTPKQLKACFPKELKDKKVGFIHTNYPKNNKSIYKFLKKSCENLVQFHPGASVQMANEAKLHEESVFALVIGPVNGNVQLELNELLKRTNVSIMINRTN